MFLWRLVGPTVLLSPEITPRVSRLGRADRPGAHMADSPSSCTKLRCRKHYLVSSRSFLHWAARRRTANTSATLPVCSLQPRDTPAGKSGSKTQQNSQHVHGKLRITIPVVVPPCSASVLTIQKQHVSHLSLLQLNCFPENI